MGAEDIRAQMRARLAAKAAPAAAPASIDTRIKIERLPILMGAVDVTLHNGTPIDCPRCRRPASRLLGYCRKFDLALVIHCGCLAIGERCGRDIAPQTFTEGAPDLWRAKFLEAIKD